MKYLFAVFFLICLETIKAQNAYDHWLKSQEPSTHLRQKGSYSIKETYKSVTGKHKDLKLLQKQYYKSGCLREDVLYSQEQEKIYHILFKLPATYTWQDLAEKGDVYLSGAELVGLNIVDSSTATYSFDNTGKLKYYVVDNQGGMHAIYTYREDGQLLRYKDCLAPFNNAYWCTYYIYEYNKKQQLSKALSYNLAQNELPDQKELFAVDSMVYNDQGLLIERWTLDSVGNVTQKASYQYNRKGQLCQEKSLEWPTSRWTRSYKKTACYHSNGQLRKQEGAYYFGKQLEARQERLYNRQGNLLQQITYKGRQSTSLYQIRYKR